jgi:hypothetical protein
VGSDSLGAFADGFWFHKCKVPFEWTQWSTLKLDVLEHGHADPFTFADVAQAGWFEVSVNLNATSSKVKVCQSETCWQWRSQGGLASLCLCHLVSFAPDDQLISSPEVPQPWVWWGAEGINMGTRFMATKEAQLDCASEYIWMSLTPETLTCQEGTMLVTGNFVGLHLCIFYTFYNGVISGMSWMSESKVLSSNSLRCHNVNCTCMYMFF